MAKDDMFVIMYRIIAYLYRCMKTGETPQDDKWSFAALGIPESYWVCVIEELLSGGYIKGVRVVRRAYGDPVVKIDDPRVTKEGVQFAQENSMMRKAANLLKEISATVPFI